MSQETILSRRKILQALVGAPMLPLASGLATAATLAGCGGGGGDGPAFAGARFEAMRAPSLAEPAAMATTSVNSRLVVDFADGRQTTYRLAYQPFFTTGDAVPDGQGGTVVAGGYYDIHGNAILDRSVPGRQRQIYSDAPDGMSLLTVDGAKVPGVRGNTVFAVVQFEYTSRDAAGNSLYGRLPSQIAVLTLDQDPDNGRLKLVKYTPVDTSAVNGLWITCGASLSPWGTHLSSEEYEPDATVAANGQLQAFSTNLYGNPDTARPYHYGHLPEVTVKPDGTGTIRKHYCLGRISHEVVQVMPDERTCLMGDDATNGGLFLFIADRARDLSAGTLYVAKWHQRSGDNGGSARLTWIRLGHATSAEIEALADTLGAAQIVDVQTTDPADAGYTHIRFAGRDNWVKFKPGQEKAAAFLETHRYAAFKGGSLGFTKMEGTTVNARDKVAYSAMSYIQGSMTDGTTDIHVTGPRAGAVYALNLKGDQKDDGGAAMDSEWVPVDMAAMLLGEDLAVPDRLGNLANPERIANPDNIKFSEQLRTLFIGEDSGMHVNNFLWAYDVDTKTLSRLLSTPAGAESTGLQAVDAIHGWTYVMSNFQHPGDWESPLHDKVKATLDPLVRANYKERSAAAVGYLTAEAQQPRLSR